MATYKDGVLPAKSLNSSAHTETNTVHINPRVSSRKDYKSVSIQNVADGRQFVDTLHTKSVTAESPCTEIRCMGSIIKQPIKRDRRQGEEIGKQATDFFNQYYENIKRIDTASHKKRLKEVQDELERTGTYTLSETELIMGAKTAWRNASRCIGRIQWTNLQVFDCRDVHTAGGMFNAICHHLNYATNKGNIRSAITIFPQRTQLGKDYRVWNGLLISYAGYKRDDGSIVGDPINVEFTEICQEMGWKGKGDRGHHDVLPLVLQAEGGQPEWFNIPEHLILEVEIAHPRFSWFKELGFKWYAVPAVSNIMLDVGGLEFTAAPFNGWYMGTEIGSRDMCDSDRYNMTKTIANHMGLDTNSNINLWKDQALVEANIAVLHSFQKKNVTISDHHTASESFMKHMENEHRLRGGCPADWVWIVPPLSGSISPVFHQEMLNYQLKPSYEYQDLAWRNHRWQTADETLQTLGGKKQRITLKIVAKAVQFSTRMMGKAMGKRTRVTILYATETGKSETYAKTLGDIFNHAFNAKVVNMLDYDVSRLEHESMLIIVASTFGNGDPPADGEEFYRYIMQLASGIDDSEDSGGQVFDKYTPPTAPDTPTQLQKKSVGGLSETSGLGNVKFSVFGLGSKAYQNFAAFGRAVDSILEKLGAEKILTMGEGDELYCQEESFNQWAKDVFKVACGIFCAGDSVDMTEANAALTKGSFNWTVDKFRVSEHDGKVTLELCNGLSKLHKKMIMPSLVENKKNLQSPESERSTIQVKLNAQGASELLYDPGDHVAVCPANEEELVDRILVKVNTNLSPDAIIKCEFLEKKGPSDLSQDSTPTPSPPPGLLQAWVATDRLPACSLREALTRFLDITTPPTPKLLHILSEQATDKKDSTGLVELSKDPVRYDDWKFRYYPNLPEVLEKFPSVKVSPSFLLTELPILKPRFYSISSSSKMHPGEIHITAAVVSYHAGKAGDGALHNGVCSSYLNRIEDGDIIPIFLRSAPLFHLPKERFLPIVMIGPGTGIAPFRGFWQERQIDMQLSKSLEAGSNSFGKMILVFGCRKAVEDNIYCDETSAALNDGALTNVLTALSREPNVPKTYVQDILREGATELFQLINKEECHIYVCGDVKMANEVSETLEGIIRTVGKITGDMPKEYMHYLKSSKRYHEDIFGVTLRTKEVTTNVRRKSMFPEGIRSFLQNSVQHWYNAKGHQNVYDETNLP